MKIGGPKPPQPPTVGKLGEIGAPQVSKTGPDRLGAGTFDKVLAGGAAKAQAPTRPSAIEAIGAQLQAGEITPTQAAEKLVEEIVRTRLQEVGPALQAQLRTHLKQVLSEDPYLSAKLQALAGNER